MQIVDCKFRITAVLEETCSEVCVAADNADEITFMLLKSDTLRLVTLFTMNSRKSAICSFSWAICVRFGLADAAVFTLCMLKTVVRAITFLATRFRLPLFN